MKSLLKNPVSPYILSIILLFGAVFLLFHELFFGKIIATNDIGTNDLLFFNFPIRVLYADALKHGELLQWTPLIYGGFPVFAEGQGGFLYPVNLFFWYLFSSIGAMNIYIIFHALFMGFGTYLLVKNITGNKILSIPSAVAASICGSIIAGHTRHLNSMTAIVYMPWLFYSVELYFRSKKPTKGLLFGVLIGVMFLSGHPQYSFISGFFAVLYLLLRILLDKKQRDTLIQRLKSYKLIYFFLLAIVVTVIIIFPQIKNTLELIPFTERGQDLSTQFTGQGSMPLKGFLTFFYPYYLGNAGDASFEMHDIYLFWEFFHYTGAIIFALALFGSIKMWKRKEYFSEIRSLLIIAVIGYLLATGENLQLYQIFSIFPFTKSFRFPVRWLAGTELSILVLSGFGVISIAEMISGKSRPAEKPAKKRQKHSGGLIKNVNIISSLNVQYAAAVIISILVAVEIYIVAGRQVTTADAGLLLDPPSYVKNMKEDNKSSITTRMMALSRANYFIGAFMKSKGWEGKQDLFALGSKMIPEDLGAYWGVASINGYFLLVPSYIYEIWGDANHNGLISKTASLIEDKNFQIGEKFLKLSKLFGVKYLTSVWNIPRPYVKMWDSLGVREYVLPDTLYKSWVVSKVEPFTSASNIINSEQLLSDNFDPWKSAYTDGNPPPLPPDSRNGTAEILEYDNHYLKIKANAPGFVVINDTWYPRWKAYIDGKEVPVYKTDVMMRGVVAPKEGTIIEMRFDKGNVFAYTVISYITIIICFGYLFYEKKKSAKIKT